MRNIVFLVCIVFLNSGCGYMLSSCFFSNPSDNHVRTKRINHVKDNLYYGDTIALLKPYVNTYYEVAKDSFVYQKWNTINATVYLQDNTRKKLMKHLACNITYIPLEYNDLVKEVYQMFDSLRKAKLKRYVFSNTSIVAKLNRVRKDYKISSDYILLPCLWWSNMWGNYFDKQVTYGGRFGSRLISPLGSTVMEQYIVIISLSKRQILFYNRLYMKAVVRYFPNDRNDLEFVNYSNRITFFHINKRLKKHKNAKK